MNQIMIGKHKLSTLVLVSLVVFFFFGLISKNMMAGEAVQNASQSVSAANTAGSVAKVAASKEKPAKKSWEDKLPELTPEETELEGTTKTLEGRVSGAGYNGLAVELAKPGKGDPSEVWLNYVKGLKLSGFDKLAEIQEGDTVRVGYKQVDDGRRFLQEISLIRKKPEEKLEETVQEEEEEE